MSIVAFPAQVSSTTFYASQCGCALDGVTDDAPIINAILATATQATPIKFIIDGLAAVSDLTISPLGFTTIEGLGWSTGFIRIPSGTFSNNGISIGPYSLSNPYQDGQTVASPAITANYIELRDFSMNLNFPSGNPSFTAANFPVSGAPPHATFGICLFGCNEVLIDHLLLLAPPYYNILVSNCTNVTVQNCDLLSNTQLRDGVHIDGPSSNIKVLNCDIATGDDGIAINCPEGAGGDINGVFIDNCRFTAAGSLVRIYTSTSALPGAIYHARNIVISNCTGTSLGAPIHIGVEGAPASTVEQVHDVIVSNCSFGSNAAESVGFLSINMPFDLVIIRDCIYLPTTTSPVVAVQSLSTAGTLELRNLKVMRNADGNAAPAFISLQNCTINKLVLDISVEDLVGSSYTPLPTVITASGAFGSGSGSTISHLVIERIGTLHITQLFDSTFGPAFTVTSVEGSGVLNTGWEIPDANMGNNSPYISSTEAGDVSIKISGVPYAFQFSSGVAPLAFNLLSSGVNLSAAMVLGSGASLTASGGGSISANELNGALVPASSAVLGSNSLGQLTNNSASFPSLTGTNLHTGANTFSGVVTGAGFTATGAAPLLIPNSTFIEALTSGGGAAAIIGVSGGAGNALLVGSPAATGTGGVHLYASGTDALDVTSLGVFSNVPLTAPNINQVLYAEFFLGLTGAVLSTTGAITPSTGLYRISTQVRVVGGATAGTVVLTANWTDSHAVEGNTMANVSLVNASNTFQSIMVIANGGTALKFNTTCAATGSYSYDLAVMFELIPAVA